MSPNKSPSNFPTMHGYAHNVRLEKHGKEMHQITAESPKLACSTHQYIHFRHGATPEHNIHHGKLSKQLHLSS